MTETRGLLLHRALGYDLLVWLMTGGRERRLRERFLALARVQPGDCVLDVACGTGTLAIAARQRVGTAGAVYGIDASAEMIARATKKARRGGIDARFQQALAQALPFPDARFDVALSTVMLHHLPRPARERCATEIRRVLKPGGRVLAVDFGAPSKPRHGLIAHFHRHGFTKPEEIITLMAKAGLSTLDSGAVGVSDLHFVLATRSSDSHRP